MLYVVVAYVHVKWETSIRSQQLREDIIYTAASKVAHALCDSQSFTEITPSKPHSSLTLSAKPSCTFLAINSVVVIMSSSGKTSSRFFKLYLDKTSDKIFKACPISMTQLFVL